MFGRSHTAHDERVAEQDTGEVPVQRTGRLDTEPVAADGGVDPVVAQEVRRERFGGLNGGAAFFGWLVAVGVSLLLTGIIGAIAAALNSTTQLTQSDATNAVGDIGVAAAAVLVVVLVIGYYCGGYVAGRMSRFSGGSQGLGVWVTGLLVTILMIVLGAVFGNQYDVFSRVNLPRLPVSTDSLTTTGIVAAVVVLAGTLIAAMAGGSVGTHYHRRVDKAGWNA
ncbi:MAG: hypothetical protein HOQ22_12005 [Nocardioidaceae bacterium]|nr:hypothetical protein [Nocardioidaceae bacterium]